MAAPLGWKAIAAGRGTMVRDMTGTANRSAASRAVGERMPRL
jgi:hypothetical protein